MQSDKHQSTERARRQRGKNLAVAVAVLVLAALFYLITIVRMGRLGQ